MCFHSKPKLFKRIHKCNFWKFAIFGVLFKLLKQNFIPNFLFVSLQHSVTFSLAQFTLRMMLLCSLCSVHRHPDFLTNCSQLNKQMSPLGLEPLVQQL